MKMHENEVQEWFKDRNKCFRGRDGECRLVSITGRGSWVQLKCLSSFTTSIKIFFSLEKVGVTKGNNRAQS